MILLCGQKMEAIITRWVLVIYAGQVFLPPHQFWHVTDYQMGGLWFHNPWLVGMNNEGAWSFWCLQQLWGMQTVCLNLLSLTHENISKSYSTSWYQPAGRNIDNDVCGLTETCCCWVFLMSDLTHKTRTIYMARYQQLEVGKFSVIWVNRRFKSSHHMAMKIYWHQNCESPTSCSSSR